MPRFGACCLANFLHKTHTQMNRRISFSFTAALLLAGTMVLAQGTPQNPGSANAPGNTRGGTATGPRPYSEVITSKAKTDRGLLTTHRVDDKYYFEIPDSVIGREILVVNRISRAAAGARAGFIGYAGDQISYNVISFEKVSNIRIFLQSIYVTVT